MVTSANDNREDTTWLRLVTHLVRVPESAEILVGYWVCICCGLGAPGYGTSSRTPYIIGIVLIIHRAGEG